MKTGGNQGVIIDSAWLARVLLEGCRRLQPQDALFSFSQACFRKMWWCVARILQVAEWIGPPHSVRHSRPSHDVLVGARSLEDVRRRGRWVSLKSVQRYTKGFILIRAMSQTPSSARQIGEKALEAPGKALAAAVRQSPDAVQSLFGKAILAVETTGDPEGPPWRGGSECASQAPPASARVADAAPAGSQGKPEGKSVSTATSRTRATTPTCVRERGELSAMTVATLRRQCQAAGLSTTGRKVELIQRLATPLPPLPRREPDPEDG